MSDAWALADMLAARFAESEHVTRFRNGMQPVPARPGDSFAIDSVHALLVRYSMLQSQPLLIGLRVPSLSEFAPLHDSSAEVRAWLDSAQRVGFAFVNLIEFLRSRLPGYPGLLLPDLVSGATRVRQDGFWDMRFPWMGEVRRAGLQFENRPDMPARTLDLPDGGATLYEALGNLLSALTQSTAWERFAAASSELAAGDRDAAKQLRREYREAIKDERVDAIAGDTGIRDAAMRRAELDAVKRKASGAVRAYFDAFDAVDELLECVAALLTHRLARGDIETVQVLSASFGPPSETRTVWLRARDYEFRSPYELIRFESSVTSLGGVVVLHGLTIHLDDELLVADGRLLTGSASVPEQL